MPLIQHRPRRRTGAAVRFAVPAVAVVVLAGACGGSSDPAPGGPAAKPSSTAEVHPMPEGFSEFASTCDGHGFRVFVFNCCSVDPVVVPDSACPKK